MTDISIVADSIINDMIPVLSEAQMERLKDSLNIHLHDLEEGTALVPSTDGNEFKIRMFIASKRAINRSENTLQMYEKEIRNLLGFLNKSIEDITAMDIRYYISILRERKGLAPATIQTKLLYLSSFWDFLQTEGFVKTNIIKQVGSVKQEKTIKKPFSPEELEKLRSSCHHVRDRAVLEFLYSTGLRVSECVSLNIGDINYGTGDLIVLGKGNKERKAYVTDSALYYLKLYLQTRADEEDFLNRPLFTSLRSPHNRLTIDDVEGLLHKIGNKAGVPDCHPHRFRRTMATDLLNRGMPVEQVQSLLGHEQINTTMIYCTINEEAVKASYRKYA